MAYLAGCLCFYVYGCGTLQNKVQRIVLGFGDLSDLCFWNWLSAYGGIMESISLDSCVWEWLYL